MLPSGLSVPELTLKALMPGLTSLVWQQKSWALYPYASR